MEKNIQKSHPDKANVDVLQEQQLITYVTITSIPTKEGKKRQETLCCFKLDAALLHLSCWDESLCLSLHSKRNGLLAQQYCQSGCRRSEKLGCIFAKKKLCGWNRLQPTPLRPEEKSFCHPAGHCWAPSVQKSSLQQEVKACTCPHYFLHIHSHT